MALLWLAGFFVVVGVQAQKGECPSHGCQEEAALLQTRKSQAASHRSEKLDDSLSRKQDLIGTNFIIVADVHYSLKDNGLTALGKVGRCEGLCDSDSTSPLTINWQAGGMAMGLFAPGNVAVDKPLELTTDVLKRGAAHAKISAVVPVMTNETAALAKGVKILDQYAPSGQGSLGGSSQVKSKASIQLTYFRDTGFLTYDEVEKANPGIDKGRIRIVTAAFVVVGPTSQIASTCANAQVSASVTDEVSGTVTFSGKDCGDVEWTLEPGSILAYQTSYFDGQGRLNPSPYS